NLMGSLGVINTVDTPGNVNITATLGNVTGTLPMIVTKAKLGSIEMTLGDEVIPKGTVLHYAAIGVYDDGSYITITHDAMWTIDDGTIGSFSQTFPTTGSCTPLMPGKTMVHVTFEGVTVSTSLTVTAANLDSIEVTPAGNTIKIGAKQQLTATAHYSDK